MSKTRSQRDSPEIAAETSLRPGSHEQQPHEGDGVRLGDEHDRSASDRPPEAAGVPSDTRIEMHIVTDNDFVSLFLPATARDPTGDKSLGKFIDWVSGESDRADLIEPVDAPDAPAALACVESVVEGATRTLGVPVPEVEWYRLWRYPSGKTAPMNATGFHLHGKPVIWLSVGYRTPQRLAVTTAHEVVHYWQDHRRGRCLDAVEHQEREGEARRRSRLLVPDGTYRTPRGKKLDAWFDPPRRRRRWASEESLPIEQGHPGSP